MFLNNRVVRGYARDFARELLPAAEDSLHTAIGRGYRIAIAREPSSSELEDAVTFVRQQSDSYAADEISAANELALADFCQVLLSLNEFIYIQ